MSKGSLGFTKFGFSRISESLLERFPVRYSAFKSSGASANAKPAAVSFIPRILSATKSYLVVSSSGGTQADAIINLNRKTITTKVSPGSTGSSGITAKSPADVASPFSQIQSFANATGNGLTIGNFRLVFENGILKIFVNGSANPQFTFDTGSKTLTVDANGDGTPDLTATLCYMAGTLIATPDGERAIETLKAGDLVITADGKHEPIRWVGTQQVSKTFADPVTTMPVLVKAGALGEGMPKRDLFLSPAHALLIDGALVQAGALVNGSSIVRYQDTAETFTYYNIELAEHALISAEGVLAETFLDSASRENYDNWAEREALQDAAPMVAMDFPRALSARQVSASTRARVAAIASKLAGAKAVANAA